MKKIEKYIYIILIIILVGVIASTTTYILTKDNKTEEKENKPIEKEPAKVDGVKLSKVYNLDDKIIEEFEVTLNGKTTPIKLPFVHEVSEGDNFMEVHNITATLNSNNLYHHEIYNYTEKEENKFDINNIKNRFNEKNFIIIRGTDNKNYLAVIPYINTDYENTELFLFNDNLEQIKGNFNLYGICGSNDNMIILSRTTHYILENDITPNYKNNFNVDIPIPNGFSNNNLNIKIENNNIYYLAPILREQLEEGDMGTLEERVYTINNNKLEYKIINKYKIVNGAGQVC